MEAEYVAFDNSRLAGFGHVVGVGWQDGIAVINVAIFGDEADETLEGDVSAKAAIRAA